MSKLFVCVGFVSRLVPVLAVTMMFGLVSFDARAAGTVTLYSSDGLEDLYKAVLPDFEKQEGVKVNLFVAGNGEVLSRLSEEKAQPKADVVVSLPPFVQQAEQDGLLQAYASANYDKIPASAKSPDNVWATFVNNYFSFAVNPEIVKTPPETFADLLEADYRFAYSNPETAGDGMAMLVLTTTVMGEDKAFAYLKELEPLVKFHTKGTGYLNVLLSRDEITVANGDLQMDFADEHIGGLVLKPIFLALKHGGKPSTFELPYTVSLVKNGANQSEGQKLIDFLLSKPVQERVPEFFGIPARSDVALSGVTGEEIKRTIAKVNVLPVDWNQVRAKKSDWTKRWRSEVIGSSDKPTNVVKPVDEN